MAAADGAWDGEVWLHGAIVWRMQLNGWRAGFLGDLLGMPDRAVSHFNAYANSQITDVEPIIPNPTPDPEKLLMGHADVFERLHLSLSQPQGHHAPLRHEPELHRRVAVASGV